MTHLSFAWLAAFSYFVSAIRNSFESLAVPFCIALFITRATLGSAILAIERWLAGWVAVCMSVTRRYCVKTAKPILKLFRPSGSSIILVFEALRRYRVAKIRHWMIGTTRPLRANGVSLLPADTIYFAIYCLCERQKRPSKSLQSNFQARRSLFTSAGLTSIQQFRDNKNILQTQFSTEAEFVLPPNTGQSAHCTGRPTTKHSGVLTPECLVVGRPVESMLLQWFFSVYVLQYVSSSGT